MKIAIDFDGTCVTHDFPRVGRDIGAAKVLKRLTDAGHKLILFTMRSDIRKVTSEEEGIHKLAGNYLQDALDWFKKNDIPLYGINTDPEQHKWTHSPKAYAEMYIDDCAFGCPLIKKDAPERPYVDWFCIQVVLEMRGLI